MFQCNHCNTEYGGIRGIVADSCPRCACKDDTGIGRRSAPATAAVAMAASWRSPQLTAPSWSLPTVPLSGAIAQLDRAARL